MKIQKVDVKLAGLSDIMFDKFIDHSKEVRPPEQKLYLLKDNVLSFPAENLYSFLFCENPAGCAKKFEGKKGKNYIDIGLGHIFIEPVFISFKDNKGKDIKFTSFDNKRLYVFHAAPRTKQGSLSIKQEIKPRPVLGLPWNLSFSIQIIKNNLIDENKLHNWFDAGGIQIGIGTYRPRFGRFEIINWDCK